MRVDVSVDVRAPRAEVWRLVSDIENSSRTISSIESIEVLERPGNGLVGLKWRETRTLYGRSATETMWITEAEDERYYLTEAHSNGAIYRTRVWLEELDGGTRVGMEFRSEPQSFAAKLMSAVLGPLIARSVRKALASDLDEIRRAAESD